MATPAHIAMLDDEADITRLLANYLQPRGYRVSQVHSGHALMRLMASDTPSVVLLDLGLPGEDGFLIARELRSHWPCGVIIVTGRNDPVDKVVGLEIGADDYVTKPFDLRELAARIKAVHRRLASATDTRFEPYASERQSSANRLCFAGWVLDASARRLFDSLGKDVTLTCGEFDLLLAFARNAGRVMSRDALLELTRGRSAAPFDRTIDVQVGRLRKKIEPHPDQPRIIRSVRGAGYMLVSSAVPHES